MKKTKQQKGITLVALVITIIILLILAAVSIQALTGSGLFFKAKKAKIETEISQEKEKIKLVIASCSMQDNNYNDGIPYDTFEKEFNIEYPNEANISKCNSRPNKSTLISLINKLIIPEVYATDNSDEVLYASIVYNSGRKYYVCLKQNNTDNIGNIFIEKDTKKDKYSIKYCLSEEIDNVSSMPIDNNMYYEDDEISVSATEPIREGYEFLGWNTDKSTRVEYVAGDKIKVKTNNIVLYAVWNKAEHGRLADITSINDFAKKVNYKVVINKNENEKIVLDNWNFWYEDGNNIWIILDGYLPNELVPEVINSKNEDMFIKKSKYFINWKDGTTCEEAHQSLINPDNWTFLASGVKNVNGESALAYGTASIRWSRFDIATDLTENQKDVFNPIRNDCRIQWDYANAFYTGFNWSGVDEDGMNFSCVGDWSQKEYTNVDAGLRITVKLPSEITGTVGNYIKIDNQYLN